MSIPERAAPCRRSAFVLVSVVGSVVVSVVCTMVGTVVGSWWALGLPPSAPQGDASGDRAVAPDSPERRSEPYDLPGVHNIVSYQGSGPGQLYSGSMPEGDAGFDSLKTLGVKTILSVDGAIPDLERARARGMRYVHLPIGYDGFEDARKMQLVRAVRDLPKPIFMHCHHGKHRSAGAAGTVAVSLGWMTNAQAAELMKVSGTAEGYKGLWACTAKAAPVMQAVIDAVAAEYPEVTKPDSMVAAMVAIDEALERIRLVEKNAWAVPADHPDLAPAADAGKLADLLRLLDKDAHVENLGASERADFRALLEKNARQASTLEELLIAKDLADGHATRGAAMKALLAGCKDCHVKYRD